MTKYNDKNRLGTDQLIPIIKPITDKFKLRRLTKSIRKMDKKLSNSSSYANIDEEGLKKF